MFVGILHYSICHSRLLLNKGEDNITCVPTAHLRVFVLCHVLELFALCVKPMCKHLHITFGDNYLKYNTLSHCIGSY